MAVLSELFFSRKNNVNFRNRDYPGFLNNLRHRHYMHVYLYTVKFFFFGKQSHHLHKLRIKRRRLGTRRYLGCLGWTCSVRLRMNQCRPYCQIMIIIMPRQLTSTITIINMTILLQSLTITWYTTNYFIIIENCFFFNMRWLFSLCVYGYYYYLD